jgi:hypothetical protein
MGVIMRGGASPVDHLIHSHHLAFCVQAEGAAVGRQQPINYGSLCS